MIPALKKQVGLGEAEHAHAGLSDLLCHLGLDLGSLHSQTHAVTGRDRVLEPAVLHQTCQVPQRENCGVERLVDVEVDTEARLSGHPDGSLYQAGPIGIEVWTPADQVHAGFDGRRQRGPIAGTLGPGHRRDRKRNELDVDQPLEMRLGLLHRHHVSSAEVPAHGHVASDGRDAMDQQQLDGLDGSGDRAAVGDLSGRSGRVPRLKRPLKIAAEVRHHLGDQGIVEMRVWFGQRGQNEPARQVVDRSLT